MRELRSQPAGFVRIGPFILGSVHLFLDQSIYYRIDPFIFLLLIHDCLINLFSQVEGARLRELRSQLAGFVRRHAQSDRTALLRL